MDVTIRLRLAIGATTLMYSTLGQRTQYNQHLPIATYRGASGSARSNYVVPNLTILSWQYRENPIRCQKPPFRSPRGPAGESRQELSHLVENIAKSRIDLHEVRVFLAEVRADVVVGTSYWQYHVLASAFRLNP